MSGFDISKVKRLKREEYNIPKITLEGLKSMCNLLDEENPATYEIFLKNRPDLSADEVAYYRNIIDILNENAIIKREMVNSRGLITYQEYLARLEPPVLTIEKLYYCEECKVNSGVLSAGVLSAMEYYRDCYYCDGCIKKYFCNCDECGGYLYKNDKCSICT